MIRPKIVFIIIKIRSEVRASALTPPNKTRSNKSKRKLATKNIVITQNMLSWLIANLVFAKYITIGIPKNNMKRR